MGKKVRGAGHGRYWPDTEQPDGWSKQLRDRRTELDLTIRELAYLAGVSNSTVLRVLHGQDCSPDSIIRVADVLGFRCEVHTEIKVKLEG